MPADGEAFADQPWVSNLAVTVRAAFGCIEETNPQATLPADAPGRLAKASPAGRDKRSDSRPYVPACWGVNPYQMRSKAKITMKTTMTSPPTTAAQIQ